MITIHNDRLNIQIQEPGSSYRRTRFDWSGICQQVTLDSSHTYCSQEATPTIRGAEGVGLTDEFGIATPIGYNQIGIGEWFPKIGVGFLQKVTADPYDFFFDYPAKPMPFQVEQESEKRVRFTQTSENLAGWAWKLRKTYSLQGASLTMDYELVNCGQKPLVTEQYNHNFVAIDGQTIGPDYQMEVSFPVKADFTEGPIRSKKNTVNVTKIPTDSFYLLQSAGGNAKNPIWSLAHRPSGHGMRVSEHFTLFKFAVWGMSHVISPELFIWIDLQPGQTQSWQRVYTFF